MHSGHKLAQKLLRPNAMYFCGFLLFLAAMLSEASSREQLDLILSEESLPGIVWATVEKNDSRSGSNGYFELSTGTPMAGDSKVQVGSVTKTVLALGVLHLVYEGRLSLESEVEHLLPMLNWNNPWRDEAPITVRHLLEHTAGLDNLRMWQFLNSDLRGDTPLAEAFPPNQSYLLRVRTRPGSQYSYSNMGYALLGMVIEGVTAERYEDYLGRALLKPLGMHDSSFFFVTQEQDSRLAMGYLDDDVPQKAVPMFLRPAGQFTTTASDMQVLIRFLLSDGRLGEEEFIAAEHMDSLGTPSTTDAYLAGLPMGHGLALAGRDRHGVLGECHPGTTFGFRARLCVFRGAGKGFFFAINGDKESADYERFIQFFIEQIDVAPVAQAKTVVNAALDQYTGLYALAPTNIEQFAWLDWMFNSIWLSVDHEGKGLVLRSLQGQQRLLLPMKNRLFRDARRSRASYVFMGDGDAVLSNGLGTWKRASPLMLCLAWLSLTAGAIGLIYIAVRGSWLVLRGPSVASSGILLPWLCLVSFSLPAYLYTRQSYLQFGELTVASALLAALSGLLPLFLVYSLYRLTHSERLCLPDLCAVLAGLQLCLLFLVQGVFPIVFWR